MRFLADESCDFRVARALRAAGHDLTAVAEISPGADDATVIDLALREDRILLTEDRDFGQLAYATAEPGPGIILIRFPATARTNLPAMMVDIVTQHADKLGECFVVLQPGRVRFGRRPSA